MVRLTRKPREITGAGAVLGHIALLVLCCAFVMCALCFCAPFWVTHRTEYYDMGLWGKCFFNQEKAGRSGCRWMWDFDWALERAMPSWFQACQVLYAFGIVGLLCAFVSSMGQLCCDLGFGSSRLYTINGLIVMFAWMCMTISIIIYGVRDYLDNNTSVNSQIKRFAWAYIVGISGSVVTFASAVLYFVADAVISNTRLQEGYARSFAELGWHQTAQS